MEIWAKMNGVTQEEIASLISKDQTTISNYFTGKTRPSRKNIDLIVKHYGLEYEEVLAAGRSVYSQKIKADDSSNQVTNTGSEKIFSLLEKHKALLNLFQQKELALEINQMLVEIEKANPDRLELARDMLKALMPKIDLPKKRVSGDEEG